MYDDKWCKQVFGEETRDALGATQNQTLTQTVLFDAEDRLNSN